MYRLDKSLIYYGLFFFGIYFLLIPIQGNYDVDCWTRWALYISKHGLKNVYNSGTNYLPGHLYQLKLFTLLFHTPDDIAGNIHYLRCFTLLFDITGALLVASLFKEKLKQQLIFILIILNISYLHNNLVWGQLDSIFTTLVFASFLCIYKRKLILGCILYLISLNFKLQAIIFFPMIFFSILYFSNFKFNWKRIFIGILSLVLVQSVILLPFIINGSVGKVWNTMRGLAAPVGQISLNAANFWYLIIPGDLRWMYDSIEFMKISFKTWGLVLVAFFFLIILIPFVTIIYKRWKKVIIKIELPELLMLFSLSVLVFFYFNTQMHERYSFPGFLFIAAYSAVTSRWWIYGLFSIAYFINNEGVLQALRIFDYQSLVFDLRFCSFLFLTIILIFLYHHFQFLRRVVKTIS